MKNNVFKVTAGNKFQAVITFLRSQLGFKPTDPLVRRLVTTLGAQQTESTDQICQVVDAASFCWSHAERDKDAECQFTYINAAFAPAPDDTVGNLFKCFGTEGQLIVNYR